MKTKKEVKAKATKTASAGPEIACEINSKEELKTFLLALKDKLSDSTAAAIYALSAMNHVMNLPEVYGLLDNENKELARDIWLRIKQSGLQVKNPPMLFKPEEDGADAAA